MDEPLELILRKSRNAPVLMSKLCLICTLLSRALLHLCQYLLEDVASGSGQAGSQSSREEAKKFNNLETHGMSSAVQGIGAKPM